MSNVELIRSAYEAYARGDLETMLGFIHPSVEWTYLDPEEPRAEPQICHGRREVEDALGMLAEHGLRAELEEVAGAGEHVMVGVRIPGLGDRLSRPGEDRAYTVLTVRDGQIVAMRDCRDRGEAAERVRLDER